MRPNGWMLLGLLAASTVGVGDASAQACLAGPPSAALPHSPLSDFAGFKGDIAGHYLSRFPEMAVEPSRKDYGDACLPRYYEPPVLDDSYPKKELELTLKLKSAIMKKVEKKLPYDAQELMQADFRIAYLEFDIYLSYRAKIKVIREEIVEANNKGDKEKREKNEKHLAKFLKECEKYGTAAIKQYEDYLSEYPGKDTEDEAMFYLAFLLDDLPLTVPDVKLKVPGKAADLVDRLAKEHPTSGLLPFGLMLLGDASFRDGNFKNALGYYEDVLQYEDSKVIDIARHRKAWCHYYQGDYQEAMEQMIEVKDGNDMALFYPKVGKAADAWDFFQKFGEGHAMGPMVQLGAYYLGEESWQDAIAVYLKLIEVFPADPYYCRWLCIVTAAARMQGDEEEHVEVFDIEKFIHEYQAYGKADYPSYWKDDCEIWAAGILLDQAVAWHREAVGMDGLPGSGDTDTMKMGVRLYDSVLDDLPGLDKLLQETFGSERLSRSRIMYWKSELLYHMNEWEGCAESFDDVVRQDPAGEQWQAAACGSLLCKINAYQTLRDSYKIAP